MKEAEAILLIWLMHAAVAAVLTAPVVLLGRKRVHWRPWEAIVIVLPFAVWGVLMFSPLSTGSKSLANLGEPFYFAGAIPVAALLRVGLGSRVPQSACAALLIGVICALAGAVFFLVPALPE